MILLIMILKVLMWVISGLLLRVWCCSLCLVMVCFICSLVMIIW